ncbi:MAG: cupredoxin domain-containing protein [Candidatus Buchananbacteria bacterium]|nr:cupredoxin domain-containing protein [Candidatus Buchananbacteria bacterium]
MNITTRKVAAFFCLLVLTVIISACVPAEQNSANTATVPQDKAFQEQDNVMLEANNVAGQEATDSAMVEKEEKILQDAPASDSSVVAPQVKTFDITARNFAFSQTEIKVKKGDKVQINFKSTDGFHDWVIDEFNAKTDQVNTGGSSSVEFSADQQGIFEFYCSVGRHRDLGMVGKLIVE